MVLTPFLSRKRPAAMVTGGVAMVCLAGAWLTPISAGTAQPTTASPPPAAHLVAVVTSLPSIQPTVDGPGGGPGGGSGGGSDGSPGNAVAPGPTKHKSDGESSSSASDGSVSGRASSSESPGPIASMFKKVGRWLGVSSDDSPESSDSAEAAPKNAKPANTASADNSDTGDADKSSETSSASGVGDVLHSVFSGVGQLFSSLFGR